MRTGFEVTAATPKRLRAAEDAPAAQSMRGERKITQAPSTDQKKVRRAMQRKTAGSRVIHHDTMTGEDLHTGKWGDVQVGDKMVGLDGAEVTHVGDSDKVVSGVRMLHVKTKHPQWGEQDHHNFAFGPIGDHDDPHSSDLAFYRKSTSKTAAMNDVGECRLCGGDLLPKSHEGNTVKAECASCGTEHSLQHNQDQKSAAQRFATFQNLSAREQDRLRMLAWWHETQVSCPNCGSRQQKGLGWASSSDTGTRMMVHCPSCEHHYEVPVEVMGGKPTKTPVKARDVGRTAASDTARLLNFVGAVWVPDVDTTPYLAQSGMSAIARRAQSVLDTKENS